MCRFIVGTGRCGSTLLSRMLAENPDVLSIFEFFTGLDWSRRFSDASVGGPEFATLISAEQPFVTAVLRRGYEVEEITYPFDGGRHRRGDPLPWILVALLPRLSDDPDTLFEELMVFAASLPRRCLALQYRALFGWLADRFGRRLWIERSGSSVEYTGSLHAMFPDARFVHLHRDGPEVALSMREHHAYRLPIALLYDAPTDAGVPASQLGEVDLQAPPDAGDPISQILASRPPAEYFGRYWSDQIVAGSRALSRLDADHYLEIRFEDLVAEPGRTLEAISDFFGLGTDSDGWIERAAALVRGAPPRRLDRLPPGAQERLLDSCLAGRRLLGRA